MAIISEADAGLPLDNVIRKRWINSASYYKWKGNPPLG